MLSRSLLLAAAITAFVGLGTLRAEEAKPAGPLDWNEPVATLAELIADLSAHRLEEAWQRYRVMLPDPPPTPRTPFDPDPFQDFQQAIGQFPTDIESLKLIATRNYSEKARRMYFVADTRIGPYVIEAVIYRHRDEWFFTHFSYQSVVFADANWHKAHEDVLPLTRLPEPVAVPLPKREPAAETAGP